MNKEEIEYLEAICLTDPRYKEWLYMYSHVADAFDVPEPVVIWLEAAMLVLVMKQLNIDKQYVFKTWNNGKSDEESYFVKRTTLYMLEHGDRRFCPVSKNEMDWLRLEVDNYLFYGKLRKKRTPKDSETSNRYELDMDFESTPMMVADTLARCNSLTLRQTATLKKGISCLLEICPDEILGITNTMTIVAYYNEVTNGGLRNEVEILKGKLCDNLNNKSKLCFNPDMECPFDEKQVRESGVSKEARIVLAVMNYMINGDYRIKTRCDCNFDDFAVAMYAVMIGGKYWTRTRQDFADMMKRLFNKDIKFASFCRWIERNSIDFWQWKTKNKGERRKKIAEDFLGYIEEVKKHKSSHF